MNRWKSSGTVFEVAGLPVTNTVSPSPFPLKFLMLQGVVLVSTETTRRYSSYRSMAIVSSKRSARQASMTTRLSQSSSASITASPSPYPLRPA
ncbi:hypothetical protein BRC67_07055 [Halobacteriales archaeon QH_3_68_24]|nr:MAG: hypothetical protein BRC67_07055 [Halobacteriales archaeon QH_3_68_24]